jgi:hypothetical protein
VRVDHDVAQRQYRDLADGEERGGFGFLIHG